MQLRAGLGLAAGHLQRLLAQRQCRGRGSGALHRYRGGSRHVVGGPLSSDTPTDPQLLWKLPCCAALAGGPADKGAGVNAEPGRWQPVQSRGFATQQSPGQPPASPDQSMLKATPRERRAALFSGSLYEPIIRGVQSFISGRRFCPGPVPSCPEHERTPSNSELEWTRVIGFFGPLICSQLAFQIGSQKGFNSCPPENGLQTTSGPDPMRVVFLGSCPPTTVVRDAASEPCCTPRHGRGGAGEPGVRAPTRRSNGPVATARGHLRLQRCRSTRTLPHLLPRPRPTRRCSFGHPPRAHAASGAPT